MPVQWIDEMKEAPDRSGASLHAAGDAPMARLQLWPYRSMTPRGFVLFIGSSALLFLFPLLATLGTRAYWVLLLFILGALALIWIMLRKSNRDARLSEELTIWSDWVEVIRRESNGSVQEWHANPYWVTVNCRRDGPVPAYLTLKGNGREIELGSFLSEPERESLFNDLTQLLDNAARSVPDPQPPGTQNGGQD